MTVRSTMSDLIQTVRDLAAIGDDYTVGAVSHWADAQVQTVLDRNRLDIVDEQLMSVSSIGTGGSAEWRLYQSNNRYLEAVDAGTATFYLRDSTGAKLGTVAYTPNYETGTFYFANTTAGSAYYLNGRAYDVYAAAAEIWRQKAAYVAERFDFSADGASFKASQLVAQYERMALAMERKATFGGATGVRSVTMFRDDVIPWHNY